MVVGSRYQLLLSVGTWLQATGALLCLVFFLGLTHPAETGPSLAGRLIVLGCAGSGGARRGVFTLTWISAAAVGETGSARAAYDLMARFVQVFPIVAAPAVYLPLAALLAGGRVLARPSWRSGSCCWVSPERSPR